MAMSKIDKTPALRSAQVAFKPPQGCTWGTSCKAPEVELAIGSENPAENPELFPQNWHNRIFYAKCWDSMLLDVPT